MPSRIPIDFDPDWYAANFRDVALSGLDPREHYRRFGSVLGRPPKGPAPSKQQSPPAAPQVVAKARVAPPAQRVVDQATPKQKPEPLPRAVSAIVDRPKGFDPRTVVPKPAPARLDATGGGTFSLDSIASTADHSKQEAFAGHQALEGYRRLLKLQPADRSTVSREGGFICGGQVFQAGPTRIEKAWLADGLRLRLMIAGGQSAQGRGGRAFRAYQARPDAPGVLRMLGQGVQIPDRGPVFHDFELLHPLMPVLLELADADGATTAFALLPFPSLLPGGLHNAELKALQTEPSPMDDFWACSEALLRQALDGDRSRERSITRIASMIDAAANEQSPLTPAVREWLSVVFGLSLESASAQVPEGLQLLLPADCVPTISVLVSPHIRADVGSISLYLVADRDSYRPRWSVALPADNGSSGAVPVVQGARRPDGHLQPRDVGLPMAIAVRSLQASPTLSREEKPNCAISAELSILIYASTFAAVERLVQSIRDNATGEIELLVSTASTDAELEAALDEASEGQRWRKVAQGTGLREIANEIRNDTLLTVSDRIDLGDGTALRAMLDLLNRDETAGSASCALLAEKIVKKDVVLQPASAGLFPTGISLVRGPHLSFGEPDAAQALPDLDYPVVANTLMFTVWRRDALANLPEAPGVTSPSSEDIRLGLDLMRSGYRNWCTTRVTARWRDDYVHRDLIDPVGPGYISVEELEEILRRVTVVRELF